MGEWRFCAYTAIGILFFLIQTLNKVFWLPNTNNVVTQSLFVFAIVFVNLYSDQDVPEKYPGSFQNHLNIKNLFYNSALTVWAVSPLTSKAVDHPFFNCFKPIASAGYFF